MLEIEKPRIECIEEGNGGYAKFVLEPLERGFGVTIGNALRRVLLSSLPGAAVTNIRIAGVDHEFTTLKGAKEDVTEIVLNMKSLAVKTMSTDKNFKKSLSLKVQGPAVVTAADIVADDEVRVLNPDLYICTLEADASLDMEKRLPVPVHRQGSPADHRQWQEGRCRAPQGCPADVQRPGRRAEQPGLPGGRGIQRAHYRTPGHRGLHLQARQAPG